ncbi:hypothetical protein [Dyella sp.]|uniref:hypothetical protein n=1 Tax=Dyella sp. TaxID=1869338 RepID=UPI002ED5F676
MTTPRANDDERLPGEDQLSALYRKLPHIEPPTALDTAVHRMARQIRPNTRQRFPRWALIVGTAASLMLAAGIAWRVGQQPTAPVASSTIAPVASTPMPGAAETAKVMPPSPVPAVVDPLAAPKPSTPGVIAQHQTSATTRRQSTLPPPPTAPIEETSNLMPMQAAKAPAPPPPPAPSAPPAPPAPPTAMDAPPATSDAARSSAVPATPLSRQMDKSQRMVESMPAQAPAAAAGNAGDWQAREWASVRDLLRQGRRDEARQRLANFHRDHPDAVLPDDLRRLLLEP